MSIPGRGEPWRAPAQPYQGGYAAVSYAVPPPPKKGRRLALVLVAVLLVAAGGAGSWWALTNSDWGPKGADTPTAAAKNLVDALGNGDVVGILDTLAPAESRLLTDPVAQVTGELKRLQVLSPDADPKAVSGIDVKATGLTFDDAERVNDHVTITKLVGGTITVTADPAKLPLATDFLDSVGAGANPGGGPQTRTFDIARRVEQSGKPFRIATVQVGGEWYPSLLYTIADYALASSGRPWPHDSIPAVGANSPEEAVKDLLQAAMDQDLTRVIQLMPPDEMAVLHDVGPALVASMHDTGSDGATVTDLRTSDENVPGGVRATITSVDVTGSDVSTSIRRDGDCYVATVRGQTHRLCADGPDVVQSFVPDADDLPPDAKKAVEDFLTGVFAHGLGVIVTQVGTQYYVSPLRTVIEQGLNGSRSLSPDDFKALVKLFARAR